MTASSRCARARLASAKQYVLYGDQWQIDARVVRWKLPALMAGVPPLYRLERLSGRYGDAAREAAATRSVHSLDDWPAPDLGSLKKSFPNWFPFVDVQFGSGAYMPLFDGARYQVFLDPGARCSPARTDRPRRKGSSAWAGETELAPGRHGRADVLSTFASKINGVASMGTKL